MDQTLNAIGTADVVALVLAIGALGTAASGIVESFKGRPLRLVGFKVIIRELRAFAPMLKCAYGIGWEDALRGFYTRNRDDMEKVLGQGIRIGLRTEHVNDLSETLQLAPELLTLAASAVGPLANAAQAAGNPPQNSGPINNPVALDALGRFEMTVDARVEGAVSLATDVYEQTMKAWASAVAVGIGLLVGSLIGLQKQAGNEDYNYYYLAGGILVGLAAVPLAPIANDVASAIQSAAKALKFKEPQA